MKINHKPKWLIVIVVASIAISIFAWIKFVKFRNCQEGRLPTIKARQKITVSLDSSGLDKDLTLQVSEMIHYVINSPDGWERAKIDLIFSDTPGDIVFKVATTDKLKSLQNCSAEYNCRVGRIIYINIDRWLDGSPSLRIPLDQYRAMIINHELGHWLGFDDWQCWGYGVAAPVMQQQSIGLGGLKPSAWPSVDEITRLLMPNRL